MRKILKMISFGCLSLFLLTGCSKTLECTKETTLENNYQRTDTMKVYTKKDKVIKVENTNITEMAQSELDMSYTFGEIFSKTINEIPGMNLVYTKIDNNKLKSEMTVDYTALNEEILQESLGDFYNDAEFYSKKEITLKEFKEKNLKDYTCK